MSEKITLSRAIQLAGGTNKLAEIAGVTRFSVYSWLSGKRNLGKQSKKLLQDHFKAEVYV